nr:protein Shroom1 [Nothobranchius furzeri]XP_015816869.2 protein Shroom1 [Nothobranchius furzeri]
MDSYTFHFERMSNVDLHPLCLPVSRLSPDKSSSSIADHLTHHQHGKGDSAYSSFSGGSTAPDYPSPFTHDDLQSSSFSHYADLKHVKSYYHPTQLLPSDSKAMDQLYCSVEAIPQQYSNNNYRHNGNERHHTNNKAHSKDEVRSRTRSQSVQSPSQPPPVPTRLDSFIATKNLENSRTHHHGTEFHPLQPKPYSRLPSWSLHNLESETASSKLDRVKSDSVYSVWRGSEQPQLHYLPSYRMHIQRHEQGRVNAKQLLISDENVAPEQQRSASILSHSPPTTQSEHLTPRQPSESAGCNCDHHGKSSCHFESGRKRAFSAYDCLCSESARAGSPWSSSQSFISSSIQHKGQFYFVTGVCKLSESGSGTTSAPASDFEAEREASTMLETHRHRDKERCHSTMDNLFSSHCSGGTIQDDGHVFVPAAQGKDLTSKSQDQENHRPPHIMNPSFQSFDKLEEIDMTHIGEIGRHSANNPIFYCGPDKSCPPHLATDRKKPISEHPSYNKREDHAQREKQQPLGEVASERINKETTPLLYHLTGASRTGLIKGNEVALSKADRGDIAVSDVERPAPGDTCKTARDATSVACNTLDDSFKKYYKEKLKDAQCKVLRETSFKRRDLLLHSMKQNSECRPTGIHTFSPSQDSESSKATLTPSVASEETEKGSIKEEPWENNRATERENGRPANVAQPQVARIGGRKRLTADQKKMCFSEPEKLNQLGSGPVHVACRSFSNEGDCLFGAECEGDGNEQQGLVAARRKIFEMRGRAQSVSSASKTNLKHLQHKALVDYMERKTGQKVAESQQPVLQLPAPSRQRHSLGEKPFEWGPRAVSGNHDGKGMKKKHHRPLSAGRILDSSSSSIRYAQFSAQSCSGQYPGQHGSSKMRVSKGPSQGKSASAESLLDQREPTSFCRNRSTSSPHAFQTLDYEENLLPVKTMETEGFLKNEAEKSSVKQIPEGQQRARKVAQRGKSMEELGASKPAKVEAMSKSSEELDNLARNWSLGLERQERSASNVAEERKFQQRENQKDKEPEVVGQKNTQGHVQNQIQRNPLLKQSSELGQEGTKGERSSSRSSSPTSTSSSRARVCSASLGSHVAIADEFRSERSPSESLSNPPSPRGQNINEREMKSTSSTPSRTKHLSESTSCSRSRASSGPESEQSVDELGSDPKHEVSLSCGVTTDPALWILPPEDETKEKVSESSVSPCTSVSEADAGQRTEEQRDPETEADTQGEKEEKENRRTPEGETESLEKPVEKPKWEELVGAVVKADQSLARVLFPLASRKTALMLMEQLLSEDTLLMEEHYKKKQEQKGDVESTETAEGPEPPSCPPASDSQASQCADQQSKADLVKKKHLLVSYIKERLQSLEESRGALQRELEENATRGEALKQLVRERCQPVELERYSLFIGDLERVVNLLLCLSARLARVQNALSIVDQHTDAEEKESLDSRHRLLCKQREDAKDLKDNLDRRENLVSTFLSRQLSAEQLQDYRHFVQTKASLLIRQKDLEEKQKLGEEQLEALSNCLNL